MPKGAMVIIEDVRVEDPDNLVIAVKPRGMPVFVRLPSPMSYARVRRGMPVTAIKRALLGTTVPARVLTGVPEDLKGNKRRERIIRSLRRNSLMTVYEYKLEMDRENEYVKDNLVQNDILHVHRTRNYIMREVMNRSKEYKTEDDRKVPHVNSISINMSEDDPWIVEGKISVGIRSSTTPMDTKNEIALSDFLYSINGVKDVAKVEAQDFK